MHASKTMEREREKKRPSSESVRGSRALSMALDYYLWWCRWLEAKGEAEEERRVQCVDTRGLWLKGLTQSAAEAKVKPD